MVHCDPSRVDRDDWQAGATLAAELQAGGSDLDEIARHLIAEGLGPIPTYRALRAGTGASYMPAKEAMHRNLPDAEQRATERLWDAAEEAIGPQNEPPA